MVSEPCLGALLSSFSLYRPLIRVLSNNSYRRQLVCLGPWGKPSPPLPTLTLGLTPNSRQSLYVFDLYYNKCFSTKISLRLQTLQVGPIKNDLKAGAFQMA